MGSRQRKVLGILGRGPMTSLQIMDELCFDRSETQVVLARMVEKRLIFEKGGRYLSNMVIGSPWHKWIKRN